MPLPGVNRRSYLNPAAPNAISASLANAVPAQASIRQTQRTFQHHRCPIPPPACCILLIIAVLAPAQTYGGFHLRREAIARFSIPSACSLKMIGPPSRQRTTPQAHLPSSPHCGRFLRDAFPAVIDDNPSRAGRRSAAWTFGGSMTEHAENANDARRRRHALQPSYPIIPPRGDYRTLLSFQKAEIIYDITFRFAHKFLAKGDRTIDQMIQAARSGKKNILEGSAAGAASKETEIKLTAVARASLQELLDDYQDFLRVRDLPIWPKDSPQAQYVRKLGRKTPLTYEDFRLFMETRPPDVVANIAICLIHQTNTLIDRQLRRLEKDFLEHGGLRERMTRARLHARKQPPVQQHRTPPPTNPKVQP
jgi:four helix bundle suffix protein